MTSSARLALVNDAADAAGAALDAVIEKVCARTAPTWPLDRFIAVNPFWGMVDRPFPAVAAELAALSGTRLLPPRSWYRDRWRDGQLQQEHLDAAIRWAGAATTPAELRAHRDADEPAVRPRMRVMDVADATRDLAHEMSWREFVVTSTSQLCAACFDEGQARLTPDRAGGLYGCWRQQALRDHSPVLLMGCRAYPDLAASLPDSARAMIAAALEALGVSTADHERYLASLLLDVNGWASWCAYRRWTARLRGADDHAIVDLLAIRAAWEWMLHRAGGPAIEARWRQAMTGWHVADAAAEAAQEHDWLLQKAVEIAWQAGVCRRLPEGLSATPPPRASVQAVFCIDVRSEVFRRALEHEAADVQTLGFAGFFGLPIEFQPAGSAQPRPQLPGLLAPRLTVTDSGIGDAATSKRAARVQAAETWQTFKAGTTSTFGFVEALGLTSAWSLITDGLGIGRSASPDVLGLTSAEAGCRHPQLVGTADGDPVPTAALVDMASSILRGMSLTRDFARIVLLVGHGSETENNPFAAGLDCGACGGQTGEINARVAAALLNSPDVRHGLGARGIAVPDSTVFLAALHNTTTDDVRMLDVVPESHAADVARLRTLLAAAGDRARRERLSIAGEPAESTASAARTVRARARDWSQVRPEWGLANNAAVIVAPREHCRHLNLAGRAFLHEYRSAEDADGSVLELIMTAPMVVAHWINFQYYASTVDNVRYGSGNKTLHNVVGGHLGVFEGNGGDLRIGLPLQSVHNGQRWVHTPLRLSVFIEAPRSAMDAVLAKHQTVRHLVMGGWLDLFQIDTETRTVQRRSTTGWEAAQTSGAV